MNVTNVFQAFNLKIHLGKNLELNIKLRDMDVTLLYIEQH